MAKHRHGGTQAPRHGGVQSHASGAKAGARLFVRWFALIEAVLRVTGGGERGLGNISRADKPTYDWNGDAGGANDSANVAWAIGRMIGSDCKCRTYGEFGRLLGCCIDVAKCCIWLHRCCIHVALGCTV